MLLLDSAAAVGVGSGDELGEVVVVVLLGLLGGPSAPAAKALTGASSAIAGTRVGDQGVRGG